MESTNGDNPVNDLENKTACDHEQQDLRTVLVAVKGQNRSAHFNAGEHTLKQGDEVVVQMEKGKAIGAVKTFSF
jgi:type IV secretory pathway TraG/TraD family ATPase VirD4